MDGDNLRNRFRGDYTSPAPTITYTPAPTAADALPVVENAPIAPSKRRRFGLKTGILTVLFIVGSGSGAVGWYLQKEEETIVPPAVKSAVALPIYTPEKLPVNFVLDEKSYSVSGEIVTYYAANSEGKKLIFTIQPRPPTFDYQTFYQKGLTGTEQFLAPAGQAAIGKAQNKLIGNLVTDSVWIILSSDTDKLKSEDLKLVLMNLKESPAN